MITIIIPTRNRAYTLQKVLNSYYQQRHVTEIIIVDDDGNDSTREIVEMISKNYSQVNTKYIKHEKRKGAAAGRITGYENASNDYILFGEDDAYLDINYTKILLTKLNSEDRIGLVSGRIIYLNAGEKNEDAKERFGVGKVNILPFNKIKFGWNSNAYITTDIKVPMTHALFLTKKDLLQKYGYDNFYVKGNGYREESDFQINAYSHGWDILITKDTQCYHLHKSDVTSGGQRVNVWKQFYWNVYYTNYFYNKYFNKVKEKIGIPYSKNLALVLFTVHQFYELIIKHFLRIPYKVFIGLFK